MYRRNQTKSIMVRDVEIGGNNRVVIQSMITAKPRNVEECVKQINALSEAGCQIVRFTCLTSEDTKAITEIRARTNIPLVADIHFNYQLAIEAVEAGIDKIRINPGNIGSEKKVEAVVKKCKEKNIPIRIGVNSGSLENDLKEKYGANNPKTLIESAKRHVAILEKLDFKNIIISLKASDPALAIEAYRLAAKTFAYPLHLGITESGTKFSGTIKSCAALGILLYEGIGSTIRISLTADPLEEIKVCRELLSTFNLLSKPKIISCPTCGRCEIDLISLATRVEKVLESSNKNITVAVMGCVVNGPGEASEADIGIAGGKNNARLFKKGKVIKTIAEEDIFEELKKEIENF